MSKQLIYVAGKVTGEKRELVLAKFAAAQEMLEQLGYEVINPIEVVKAHFGPTVDFMNIPWKVAMRICIKAMMDVDHVYMLSCYPYSKGANTEHNLALLVGMELYYQHAGELPLDLNGLSSEPVSA